MKPSRRRVLLVLGWYDYRLHRGIEQYAQEHGWHLSEDLAREKVIPWGWDGNGILAWLGAGDDLAEFVFHAGKPTVDFSLRRPNLKFARVLEDHRLTARLVAEHFLSRGFRNFAFYSDADNWVYKERGEGFVEALKEAGYPCTWLKWHQVRTSKKPRDEWKRKRDWLTAQMKNAAKPLAIFGASDGHALDLLESCESAGVAVPEQVAIVGAGNSLLAVDAMHTPISSVDVNLETLGYRGAALLDELMDGKPPPKEPIRVPPAGLIARKSSDLLAINHPGVARSLRFVWERFNEPIGVDDLARIAGMSRRGFHQAFLEQIGRPPGHELHRVRIEHAKKLLASSTEKTDSVAEMCGYENANSFWVAFRQATGMSPKKYRKEFSRHREG